MSIFAGIHEVRTKTATGIFAGYFDSEAGCAVGGGAVWAITQQHGQHSTRSALMLLHRILR